MRRSKKEKRRGFSHLLFWRLERLGVHMNFKIIQRIGCCDSSSNHTVINIAASAPSLHCRAVWWLQESLVAVGAGCQHASSNVTSALDDPCCCSLLLAEGWLCCFSSNSDASGCAWWLSSNVRDRCSGRSCGDDEERPPRRPLQPAHCYVCSSS